MQLSLLNAMLNFKSHTVLSCSAIGWQKLADKCTTQTP